MWYTDTITLQTGTPANTEGSVKVTWAAAGTVLCDVQHISKDKAYKEYGLTDANQYKKVFAPAGSGFAEGNEVLFDSISWMVRVADDNLAKIGGSNHMEVILSRVI